ncbi:hypothetical protein MNBD_GAMMA21-1065 [hydrothermal vent metagenome]|uniref:OmpA-like domain-containing protein n=1 Tax=hydrothermal vent metagenome TaxID=652676 RepID=A0A3B0ZVW9_9ZZZZ
MNLIFNKKLIARNITLALAIGVITTGCAGNSPQQTQTSKVEKMPVEQTIATADSENISKPELAENNSDIVNAVEVEAKIETNSAASVIPYPDIDISENTRPGQLNFQFGFDKAELSDDDANILKQHAKFLVDNPEVVLNVNGHTDHYGPKVYNEYLSKKRADAVAKILIEAGVSESQIQISALANSEPLLDVDNTRMNRRVELKYTEMNMVSAE